MILALGLIARLLAALLIGREFQFADEALYVDAARRLLEGQGFGTEYGGVPAYPVFLGLLLSWFPSDLTVLRAGQAAVAAMGSVLVFWVADRMIGRRAAIAAAAVYALDPLLVIGAGLLYPEAVAALLLPPIVLTALNASARDRPGWAAISGVLLGLLALLRPVALVLPPIVAGWIVLTVSGGPWRRLAHVGALALAVLLVLGPWTVRNYRVHDGLVPVTTAGSRMISPKGQEKAPPGLLTAVTREFWKDPGHFASRTVRNFVQFWELAPTRMVTDDWDARQKLRQVDPRLPAEPLFPRTLRNTVSVISFTLELIVALVGLVVVARNQSRLALLPASVIVGYAAGYALLVVKLRYRMPVLPLLFLFTGAGAVALYSWLARTTHSDVGAKL